MDNTIASTAWLCSKERAIQTDGLKGLLKFEAGNILFQSEDNNKNITITPENLKLADLNNIMAHTQVAFHTNDGNSYVFVLSRPVTVKESLIRVFLYHSFIRSIIGFRQLSSAVIESKKWKETLVRSLPENKVRTRKEIRGWFIALASIGSILVIIAILILVVVILLAND